MKIWELIEIVMTINEETRANEKIILKNGEKSIITIKAKVKIINRTK